LVGKNLCPIIPNWEPATSILSIKPIFFEPKATIRATKNINADKTVGSID